MAGAERIFRLLDTRPDWEDAPVAVALPDPRAPGPAAPPAAGMRVEFRRVSFGYDPARLVLQEIEFTAEPGRMVRWWATPAAARARSSTWRRNSTCRPAVRFSSTAGRSAP